MQPKQIVFLTGASGSGKTTLTKRCSELSETPLSIHHFDDIEVPSVEHMIAHHGSAEDWQRHNTFAWLEKLTVIDESNILFEGQSRIEFIVAASAKLGFDNIKTILIDCDDKTRLHRLLINREQPELANDTMLNWASFLRAEATRHDFEILDTSKFSLDECSQIVIQNFR